MDFPPDHPEVFLSDGPHAGQRFTVKALPDTLFVPDTTIPDDMFRHDKIDLHDPPYPMSIYELHTEYIGADGEREGTYRYIGHRYPVST